MTSFQVRLLDSAELDAAEAMHYYDGQRPGLGNEFLGDLIKRVEALSEFWAYEIKYGQYRMRRLKRFPYVLYFKVNEMSKQIDVEAVLHERAFLPHA